MMRILCTLLILLLVPASALANSWGLKGDLLTAVLADDRWDDYTSASDQVGNVCVMTSRYHNALMLVTGKNAPLQVYTRAVWQPDDNRGYANLEKLGDGFILTYKKNNSPTERYVFDRTQDGYVLTKATIGDFTLTLTDPDGRYLAIQSGESAQYSVWGGLTLERFSIRLLPRSIAEVRRLNEMRAALDSGSDVLSWYEDAMQPGRLYTPGKKGTVPVYGAPAVKAWRAGSGKASVSTNGDIYVLREWVNDKGETWLHIRYEVSQRTHRFGFIRASELPGYKVVGSDAYPKIAVPVRVVEMTSLTDDPLLSQYGQHLLLPGTELTAIGTFGDEYALVQTKISGKEAWLFAPLKHLEPVPGEVLPEVMAQLEGCWFYWAGGSMAGDYLRFCADGTFYNPAWPEECGAFTVTAYDTIQGKYWDNPPYEITLRYSDGRVNVRGLSFSQVEYDWYDESTDAVQWELRDSFGLTNWEGSGGYIRINEEDVPRWESADGNG